MTELEPIDIPVDRLPTTGGGRDELLAAVTRQVLGVPGVLRLEPTLSTAGPRVILGGRATDGVRVLVRADRADADVDVATSRHHQARAVSHAVQAAVAATLVEHGLTSGTVSVSVLSVEDEPAPPRP